MDEGEVPSVPHHPLAAIITTLVHMIPVHSPSEAHSLDRCVLSAKSVPGMGEVLRGHPG